MANNLNEDLTNHVVIIKAEDLKPSLDRPELRAFRVLDGFGANSFTMGTALLGEFLFDGDKCRLEGWMVERFATEDEIADAETIRSGTAREGLV